MDEQTQCNYEFGSFRVEPAEQLLRRNNEIVPLTPKAYETLLVLVRQSGHVVGKDELMKEIWPNTFVEEANLAHNISMLRKALGESPNEQQFIQTVPKRGYRFIPEVTKVANEPATPVRQEQLPRPSLTLQSGVVVQDRTIGALFANRSVKKMTVSGLVLLLLAFAGLGLYLRSRPENVIDSLAVLPFTNGSESAQSEYLSDGITESLINNLSQLPDFRVKSRNLTFHYKGKQINPQQVGGALGVSAILTGKVVQQGDALIIQADLVRVSDGSQIWGRQYSRKAADIFEIQEEISRNIAQALRLKLSSAEQQLLARRYTENTEAYHSYLKGRFFANQRTPAATQKAVEFFEQATKLDPEYVLPYAGLANAYVANMYQTTQSPKELIPKARAAVMRALALNDTIAETHAALGNIKLIEWDWAAAEKSFKRAKELNLNYEPSNPGYERLLCIRQRCDEAVDESKRILELDPVSVLFNRNVALSLYLARRYDEAIEQSRKTAELDPNMPSTYLWLAKSYEQKALYDLAIEGYLKAGSYVTSEPEAKARLRTAYQNSGWLGYWREFLNLLQKRASEKDPSEYLLAETYARLGEKDQAFFWLEKAFEQHNSWMIFLSTDPLWDQFRSDSRYASIIRRMNLEP